MFLVSSNPRKLAEIARFGLDLDLRPGKDLPEVAGTPEQVALYKALAAGPGAVVEDTVLWMNGVPVVDIRWRLAELAQGPSARLRWTVTLAHHAGDHIALYQGTVEGHAVPPATEAPDHPGSFGFDPYFQPDGYTQTLAQLDQQGRKDDTSARRRAVEALLTGQSFRRVPLADLPPWTGDWQHT